MRVTLASLLAESMKDVSQFHSETIDAQQYLQWVDKYQVTLLYFCFFYIIFCFLFTFSFLFPVYVDCFKE